MLGMMDLGSFGDARRKKRGHDFLAALMAMRTACVRTLAGDRPGAVRFGALWPGRYPALAVSV